MPDHTPAAPKRVELPGGGTLHHTGHSVSFVGPDREIYTARLTTEELQGLVAALRSSTSAGVTSSLREAAEVVLEARKADPPDQGPMRLVYVRSLDRLADALAARPQATDPGASPSERAICDTLEHHRAHYNAWFKQATAADPGAAQFKADKAEFERAAVTAGFVRVPNAAPQPATPPAPVGLGEIEGLLAKEESDLRDAVANVNDEDGPGIMPGDVEGAFHRIRDAVRGTLTPTENMVGLVASFEDAVREEYTTRHPEGPSSCLGFARTALLSACAADKVRITELERVLRPIAEAADQADADEMSDRDHLWESAVAMGLSAGDLRRVRAAASSRLSAHAEEGFNRGDLVRKVGGDHGYTARVSIRWTTLDGHDRYVVEIPQDRGALLHIVNGKQLELATRDRAAREGE